MDQPPRSAWLCDPLVLDGGLQLGILWCHRTLGSLSLPGSGARYRQYQSNFPSDGVSAVLTVRESKSRRLTADVNFLDGDSRLVARMEDFSWTVAPFLNEAFGRATAAETPGEGRTRCRAGA